MTYDEIKAGIQACPKTWLPALLTEIVRTAIEKQVFKPGGATNLVRRVEFGSSKPEPRCPECGSRTLNVESISENEHLVYCVCCDHSDGSNHGTIDAALGAWMKGGKE